MKKRTATALRGLAHAQARQVFLSESLLHWMENVGLGQVEHGDKYGITSDVRREIRNLLPLKERAEGEHAEYLVDTYFRKCLGAAVKHAQRWAWVRRDAPPSAEVVLLKDVEEDIVSECLQLMQAQVE